MREGWLAVLIYSSTSVLVFVTVAIIVYFMKYRNKSPRSPTQHRLWHRRPVVKAWRLRDIDAVRQQSTLHDNEPRDPYDIRYPYTRDRADGWMGDGGNGSDSTDTNRHPLSDDV